MSDRPEVGDAVVVERVLPASVEVVWRMWTDPAHFAEWYGPDGATVSVATMEVRVGGTRLVGMAMSTPRGPMQMWFTGQYREVVEHRRLVYSESLCDEAGRVLSAAEVGMPEGYPAETQVIVELDDLGGHTKLVVTHRGVPAASPGAAGWTMALDKLGAVLDPAVAT